MTVSYIAKLYPVGIPSQQTVQCTVRNNHEYTVDSIITNILYHLYYKIVCSGVTRPPPLDSAGTEAEEQFSYK